MAKEKILIVDDEEIVRISLEAYLEDEGYEVISAISGEEALEILDTNRFDIGIIDMRLPGIDGDTLIVKAKKLIPDMKFLVHTGSMGYSLSESLLNIGVSDTVVFKKPIRDMGKFVNTIKKLLK